MLKPYLCVACEKVIIANDTVPSLIAIFSKVIVVVPAGAEIPKNAVSPYRWVVFSIWDAEAGDEQKQYVLCTQIRYPDGTQFADVVRNNMPVERDKRCQMLVQFVGFPVGQVGQYTVLTWIEESERKVFDPIDLKLSVELVPQEPSPAKAAT